MLLQPVLLPFVFMTVVAITTLFFFIIQKKKKKKKLLTWSSRYMVIPFTVILLWPTQLRSPSHVWVFEESCHYQHVLAASAGFASLLPQAAQSGRWSVGSSPRIPPISSDSAECLAVLCWPWPRFCKGSSSLPLLSYCYWFHFICCPESVAISYKPARFACMIVLLSRWMFSSGYLVLIWFSYCFVCTQGKRFCIKILLECWVTWTLLLCHVLNCLSTGPGYVISCKMCFLFPHRSFAWMASKLSTY